MTLKKLGYGRLKLRPDEFWDMTLLELAEMHTAFLEEENRLDEADYWRTAWLASHLMNATGNVKGKITPEKLLGKKPGEPAGDETPKKSREEAKRELAELKKQFGVEQ